MTEVISSIEDTWIWYMHKLMKRLPVDFIRHSTTYVSYILSIPLLELAPIPVISRVLTALLS